MKKIKTLICHRGALGDFILTWPALYQIKKSFPVTELIGLGRPPYMALVQRLGLIDRYCDCESAALLPFFSGTALPEPLADIKYAVGWLTRAAAVKKMLKLHGGIKACIFPPFPDDNIHVADYHCRQVSRCFPSIVPKAIIPVLNIKKGAGDYVLVHPGSGSKDKNFSPGFYRQIADWLKNAGKRDLRIILGPAEEALKPEFKGLNIITPSDVNALADLLAGAGLYIGNDSGVSHLAGILGVPTVALYKSTDPVVWGVMGAKSTNIGVRDEKSAIRELTRLLSSLISL